MKINLSLAVVLLATAVSAQTPNPGNNIDQLRDLAKNAKNAGDFESEANYLCQAAALDEKKYGKKCNRAKDDASRALAKFQADLAKGRADMQGKDYPGALRDLGKITFGPNKPEAQELIEQARVGVNGGNPIDPASLAAFKAAREAYSRGDLDTAEAQAKLVQAPTLQPWAKQLLTNISIYRDDMKQAEAMLRNGDLKGAEQEYQFAAVIQQNGPGHPAERLREVEAAEARAAALKPQPQQSVTEQTALQVKVTQPQPGAGVNHAARIKNSLDTARREEAQSDLKNALLAYNAVLGLDARQAEAVAGKARVLAEMQQDPKPMEDSLKEAVVDFYASHFSQASDSIHAYLQGGGKHYAGAAHFYMGASLLMQSFLTHPKDQPQADDLRQQALDQFVLARQLHYTPIESSVSPKVFAQWAQTGNHQ